MEGESSEPKKFSYPNADRSPSDSGAIVGPGIGSANEDIRNEQRHPTVHLVDALQSQPAPKIPNDMQNIRTFQSDVANAVQSDNVSLIKIALAEKKRQERQGTYDLALQNPSNTKTWMVVGVIIVVLLIIGGGIILGFSFSKPSTTPNTSNNTSYTTPTFETETVATIDVKGKDAIDLERIIQTEKGGDLPLGAMKQVKFIRTSDIGVVEPLTTESWFSFLKTRAPSSLVRAFEPGFIFGFYSITPRDTFIIFKVNSYDNAYAGMLAWEPDMEYDIGQFIFNRKFVKKGENGEVLPESQFNGKAFIDKVINNKDVRVLLDDEGKIKMLYSFIDQETIVITSSESALREVVFRLTTGRISR